MSNTGTQAFKVVGGLLDCQFANYVRFLSVLARTERFLLLLPTRGGYQGNTML